MLRSKMLYLIPIDKVEIQEIGIQSCSPLSGKIAGNPGVIRRVQPAVTPASAAHYQSSKEMSTSI